MPVTTCHRRVSRVAASLAGALLVVLAATSAHAQALKVEWTGSRVSIAAANVPLAAVLTEVARATGSAVVGLEKATDPVTVDIDQATLHDALRTLLADKNYIYFERHEAAATQTSAVKLWIFRPGQAVTPGCMAPGGACAEGAPGVVAFDGTAAGAIAASSPFGPSPAEAETARLNSEGAFNPDAPHASLVELTKATDPGVRIRALQTLALQNTPNGVQAIKSALTDADPFVRSEAMDLLGSLAASSPLSRGQSVELLAHPDRDVRLSATIAIGEEPGGDADEQLKRALADEDEGVRNMAARMLEQRASQQKQRRPKNQ